MREQGETKKDFKAGGGLRVIIDGLSWWESGYKQERGGQWSLSPAVYCVTVSLAARCCEWEGGSLSKFAGISEQNNSICCLLSPLWQSRHPLDSGERCSTFKIPVAVSGSVEAQLPWMNTFIHPVSVTLTTANHIHCHVVIHGYLITTFLQY